MGSVMGVQALRVCKGLDVRDPPTGVSQLLSRGRVGLGRIGFRWAEAFLSRAGRAR